MSALSSIDVVAGSSAVRSAPSRWVFYDGDCPMCVGLVQRFEGTLAKRRFNFAPLQTPWVSEFFSLKAGEPLAEMKVLTPDGNALGGADAVAYLAGRIWWTWPLYAATKLPGGMTVLRRAYQYVAAHRTCSNGPCALPQKNTRATGWLAYLPLLILTSCALAIGRQFQPWVQMWTLAIAIFVGCKWLSWWPYRQMPATLARHFGYLLAWPGIDAATFLDTTDRPRFPKAREWAWATMKTTFGAALLWAGVWEVPNAYPLLRGWTALFALIFLLHFGTFHLLSLAWRAGGVNAPPLMRKPALSTSLGDFWGGRWNSGFHELAAKFLFKPLRVWLGATGAMFLVFLLSGLIHDLVISLPAGAGYGLPTSYFLLQAAGLRFERSSQGRKLGLGRGPRGWLFMFAVAGVPAFWLFHPWFVMRVVIPFLDVLRATPGGLR